MTFNTGSTLTPASKLLAGAALPDVASMAQTQGNAKLQEFVDMMGAYDCNVYRGDGGRSVGRSVVLML